VKKLPPKEKGGQECPPRTAAAGYGKYPEGRSLQRQYFLRGILTAAAKAGAANKPMIAALKRRATQNQTRRSSFSAACGQKNGHVGGRARNWLNLFLS